uniref:Uncharacterized protein n=1 Tax=Rhizophora mucronata TaxID=61149 RepID=A0A2P2LVY3_RHIMU
MPKLYLINILVYSKKERSHIRVIPGLFSFRRETKNFLPTTNKKKKGKKTIILFPWKT